MDNEINKPTVKLERGCRVYYQTIIYQVTEIIDLEFVVARRYDTGVSEKIEISGLVIINEADHSEDELFSVTEEAWEKARNKFEIIKPLIQLNRKTKEDVEERAKLKGVHSATVYRWIRQYESTGKVSALLTSKKIGGAGKSRLELDTENIILDVIEKFYLTKERPSIPKTIRKVMSRCKKDNVKLPSETAVRNRITRIKDRTILHRRIGSKQAMEQFGPYPDKFPDANFPLAVVQIDHTPLDLIIVDEENREPIGRPWITVAMDIYSRVVAGYYLSLEKPSALSVGLCLTHSILTKESRIAELDIDCYWPVMGIPRVVHVDNAKEFEGKMLERACNEHDIDIHLRPVDRSSFGGHIERYLGTLNKEIHELPGTTYSNPTQKSTYDSDGNAVFTLKEIDQWITILICNVYHNQIHSETKQMPIERFKQGIMGDNNNPGIGLPKLPYNSEKFKLDFMPFEERTIQQVGVKINNITYYTEVLRTWINAKDPEKNKYKRKFIFRYDPRDISIIYFYDPELHRYYEIPYRNMLAPRMTLWELRAVQKSLKEKGLENYDEDTIFRAYRQLNKLEENAKKTTKSARKNKARKKYANESTEKSVKKADIDQNLDDIEEDIDTELKPFEDIRLG